MIDPNLRSPGLLSQTGSSQPYQSAPSLPPLDHAGQQTGHDEAGAPNDKALRKARLRRETEAMRELLKSKERELEEMDGEG